MYNRQSHLYNSVQQIAFLSAPRCPCGALFLGCRSDAGVNSGGGRWSRGRLGQTDLPGSC